MPEKAKRKANPRRRTLFRLILGIGILVALIAGTIQVLRPKGAEIVYIAPDEDGTNQVWLMNLNNPERPRQLTEFDNPLLNVWKLQSASDAPIIVFYTYHEDNADDSALWQYDLRHDKLTLIQQYPIADDYFRRPRNDWSLHSSGEQIAFTYDNQEQSVFLLDLQTLQETEVPYADYRINYLQWVGDSDVIFSIGYDYERSETMINMRNILTDAVIRYDYPSTCLLSPDGKWCATNVSDGSDPIAPELVGLSEIGSSERLYIPLDWKERPLWFNLSTVTSYFHGWFPDSKRLLITDSPSQIISDRPEDAPLVSTTLNIYDIETQTQTSLIEIAGRYGYGLASFNHDSSQFIITRISYETREAQHLLFDLETGEETIFPIAGRYPQWVNGGR